MRAGQLRHRLTYTEPQRSPNALGQRATTGWVELGQVAARAVEEVEVDYEGEGFEIGFNARYLLDVAGQIQENTAEFRFADPASPTLVLDPADAGVRYVLMPLRV